MIEAKSCYHELENKYVILKSLEKFLRPLEKAFAGLLPTPNFLFVASYQEILNEKNNEVEDLEEFIADQIKKFEELHNEFQDRE
ncbi:MAG: hypothetical protein PV345_05600 [Wolbachia sp.]|nr:hypothetical protein [Wolbachia sp.]